MTPEPITIMSTIIIINSDDVVVKIQRSTTPDQDPNESNKMSANTAELLEMRTSLLKCEEEKRELSLELSFTEEKLRSAESSLSALLSAIANDKNDIFASRKINIQ